MSKINNCATLPDDYQRLCQRLSSDYENGQNIGENAKMPEKAGKTPKQRWTICTFAARGQENTPKRGGGSKHQNPEKTALFCPFTAFCGAGGIPILPADKTPLSAI